MGKEKPGNGKALKPYRWWHGLWRTTFGIDHHGVRWSVDVNFFDMDERAELYRDGRQERTQRLPARFILEDGARIEVRASTYGLRRADLTTTTGSRQPLQPMRGTPERWRADLEQRRPALSRVIAAGSFLVLLTVIILQLPQGIEWLTNVGSEVAPALPEDLQGLARVLDNFTFTSPWHFDGAINTVILVAGLLALLERALRLRYSWWLDGMEGMDGSWGD